VSLVNEQVLEWHQSQEYFRQDLLPLSLFINHSQPSAIFPYENLRNHYYPEVQSTTIGRTFPPVGQSLLATFQKGWGATYQLTDENQRQLALAMSLQNPAPYIFRTAKQ
jgi:hypothetical protein